MATIKTLGGFIWTALNIISWLASKAAGSVWDEAAQAKAFKWATIVDWCVPGIPLGSALVILAVGATLVHRTISRRKGK